MTDRDGPAAPDRTVRQITIRHVAERAGVSIKSVSRVLNKEPAVSAAIREAVERAAAELNYRPNISARALAGARSYLIGLVYDNPSSNYVSELQIGAMAACKRAGYHLVIEQVESASLDVRTVIREAVGTLRLDGVLLSPPLSDNDLAMSELEALGIPYVRIAPYLYPDRAPSVGIDDQLAAAQMTFHLWDRGHRDIAFIAPPQGHAAAARRRDGFLHAMAERGGAVPPGFMQEGAFTTVSGIEAGHALLALPTRPTAIFASNDDMATGVMIAAYQAGIDLPGDLSVVGFDDSPIARSLHPLLTTVRQPTAAMAEAATDMLIRSGQARAVALDFDLVMRGSVAIGPAAR
ncbi:MAG TPA: LacI family DNA-binding transcriptional regulator [Sphingobium sp.]|nr:LacI family DNA-binding transcriptional regulator [Sphingobium sp.]